MPAKANPAKTSLADKVKAHLRALESGKRAYKRSDRLFDELLLEMEPGQIVEVGGKRVRLKDKGHRFNVGLNARRFEFEVLD
jgi:hypothetical protein